MSAKIFVVVLDQYFRLYLFQFVRSDITSCVSVFSIIDCINMSCVVRKLYSGFPPRFDMNQAIQPQKMARRLKFRI